MNNVRPLALLLCGPSLAGKSTLARKLAYRFDAVIVSADLINEERGLPFGAVGLPESVWAETLQIELQRIEEAGLQRRTVILDDTCCYRWLRDKIRATCLGVGLNPVLLVFRAEWPELKARHAATVAAADRAVLPIDSLAAHVASFEWPEHDEVQLSTAGLSVEQVAEALSALQSNAA